MFFEVDRSFASFEEWCRWDEALPQLRQADYIAELARSILLSGFIDPSLGVVRPHEIQDRGTNYREGLRAKGATSRYRALLRPAIDYLLANGWCSPVYLAEYATEFGEMAPLRFPYLLRSEYLPNEAARQRFPYIRHEDPVNLTLPDRSFDLYLSADTMIYAPSPEAFLKEARRVLRRGGMLLATFPFRYGEVDTTIHSALVDGAIVRYAEPVDHDDRLDPSRRQAVFFTPGWDVLEMARSAGFASAEIMAHSSRTNAVLGEEIAVIFVLKASG